MSTTGTTQAVTNGAQQVTAAAKQAGNAISPIFDGVIDALGGWAKLDETIRNRNPMYYEFPQSDFLQRINIDYKASKMLLALIPIAILQSILPILMTPIGFIADFLGFIFLYNTGLKQLKSGLRTAHAESIKSLLTVFLITSTAQLIPSFLFDSSYHFGSMWSFFFPVLLFTKWSQSNKDATIASSICDTFFAQFSTVLHGLYPDAWKGDQGQSIGVIVGVVVLLLFWVGYLGATGSFLTIWFFLAISTINTIGEYVPDQTTQLAGYRIQQTIWHNLLAIWMFRFLISTLESISIPGIVSLLDVVLHHLPSYFLWITIFLFAMLLTKKTVDDTTKVADTWYARWLLGTTKLAPASTATATATVAPAAQTVSSSHRSSSRSKSKQT